MTGEGVLSTDSASFLNMNFVLNLGGLIRSSFSSNTRYLCTRVRNSAHPHLHFSTLSLLVRVCWKNDDKNLTRATVAVTGSLIFRLIAGTRVR